MPAFAGMTGAGGHDWAGGVYWEGRTSFAGAGGLYWAGGSLTGMMGPAEQTGSVVLMAEGEGFEPPKPVKVCRFSRPVQSTALPPLLILP